MVDAEKFVLSYAWLLALVAGGVLAAGLVWRARAKTARRERRRTRNIARQRTWDWLMMRRNVKRLTHHSGGDQP